MDAGEQIRSAFRRVAELRAEHSRQPQLGEAVRAVKAVQARRFEGTYPDLLSSGPSAQAARFFLEELYSDRDFSSRDSQFSRIAGAIDKFFPAAVTRMAVDLATLHALTEELDDAMARVWGSLPVTVPDAQRYVAGWRAVGRRTDRRMQLSEVIAIGEQMMRFTRMRGLRTALRMMRGPATAAGLESLQHFLETGFDTFAQLSKAGDAQDFLRTIQQRESALIESLFDDPLVACETSLARLLGQAP